MAGETTSRGDEKAGGVSCSMRLPTEKTASPETILVQRGLQKRYCDMAGGGSPLMRNRKAKVKRGRRQITSGDNDSEPDVET